MGNRRQAIQKAKEYQAIKPLFLDTETTGLDSYAEIIEICIVDYDDKVLVDTLVRPTIAIPPDSTRINGITDEMVKTAPTWLDVWPGVQAVLQGRYVGIYNVDFDVKMMRQSHQKYGIPWELQMQRFFDVMKLYSDYRGISRFFTLQAAGRECGIAIPNSHRARDDTRLLRALFYYIASRMP
jgi:DNA polymerase III epsilon subunit-like protein